MSDDDHSAHYKKIFFALLAALAVSLVIGHFSSSTAAIALIFVIAAGKAYLVLMEFMHVKDEPMWVKGLFVSIVVVLGLVYFGLTTDILGVFGNTEAG